MRKSFFTAASLGGMAGATTATVLLCNTIQSVSGWFHRGAALGIAIAVTFAITFLIQERPEGSKVGSLLFMTLLNGCLVYFSAFGLQNNVLGTEQGADLKTVSESIQVVPRAARIIRDPDGTTREIPIPAVYETRERQIMVPAERTFTTKW